MTSGGSFLRPRLHRIFFWLYRFKCSLQIWRRRRLRTLKPSMEKGHVSSGQIFFCLNPSRSRCSTHCAMLWNASLQCGHWIGPFLILGFWNLWQCSFHRSNGLKHSIGNSSRLFSPSVSGALGKGLNGSSALILGGALLALFAVCVFDGIS